MFKGLGNIFNPAAPAAPAVVENAVTTSNWGGGRTRMVSGSLPVEVNALGNVYGKNGIVPFSKGGIVDRPAIFPFANGVGLMSEAGPEAIMPLKRGKGGRLGVEVAGGGGTTVNVSVDAKGTNVEGDEGQARGLGKILAVAIKTEISKQQRPGGILYR
jgi:lambda family phage tail tape measure protein